MGQGEGQRALFPHVPSEVVQPVCSPVHPGTQHDAEGGTPHCTGASWGSRTRLCRQGKLRASEAAGAEVTVPAQRGRLVQGSQLGPALMLRPAPHGPRAGQGGEPHSLTLGDGPRVLADAARHHALCAAARFRAAAARPPGTPSPPPASLGCRCPACLGRAARSRLLALSHRLS